MTGTSFFSVEKISDGRSGGTTQAESRVYNERLIVTLVRRHGQLAKADLTRLTGLAAQTITTLVNRAAESGLLLRREPLRGRLGQPSVPYSLNPEAAYSFGLKVDHRSADVALVNFVGDLVAFERIEFDYPTPGEVMGFAKGAVAKMCRKHKAISTERIAGLGIASPFHRGSLGEESGLTAGRLDAWKEIDIRAELDRAFDWPVFLHNDATVSAAAELMFGAGAACADFLYAYIGYFVGGGLVLDHHLFPGRNKLAGALGDVPVPAYGPENDRTQPLLRTASLRALAGKLNGHDDGRIWSSPDDWGDLGAPLAEWIDEVSDGLAYAARGAVALLDIDNVVIDGAIPAAVRKEIAKATRRKLARALVDRPEPFSVLEGSFGHLGPAIGGASIPLLVKYSNDKDLLFKE
ncbi:ROK family transcriptional regulator [Mesorhizobium sp. IMUNJ 23232]|uniref:ROK family transcriptional regulator n=1 Tax=Mesorhizobium sp. IMUNJ 23232 TaxID=3376064 RepID=UPI0037A393A6